MSETETNLAGCRTQCKQKSDEIEDHLATINRLNGQIEKLKNNHSEETDNLNGIINEKIKQINGLESELEKCKESINCKSLEIDHLNKSNDERNSTINSLEVKVSQLLQDIENLKTEHSCQMKEKV